MNAMIKVLLVDDHAIVRKGIIALLETEADILIVGEASNGLEAVRLAESLKPDVILMDLVMPGVNGVDAICKIKAQEPAARILVLTSFGTDDKVFPALKAGALGYLLKDSNPQELIEAIRQVQQGESWLHPAVARKVLNELMHTTEPSASEKLTERETDVLKLLAHGLSNRDIAERLVISEATVRTHVSSLLAKLHLASRTQAALYALREGLASLEQEKGK
jgi:NarL family two-component system response regulator LiaR